MIGDAISHAVLPGIFIAYLVSGSAASLPVLVGASLSGILASVLIEWFSKKVRLQTDASIGLSYTFLFALGVILVSKFGQNVDLDQQCVLYGELEYVGLSTSSVLGIVLPKQAWIVGAVSLILIAGVLLGYKGLVLTTFDPAYAASTGVAVAFWHYFLMSGVSLTTVVSFGIRGSHFGDQFPCRTTGYCLSAHRSLGATHTTRLWDWDTLCRTGLLCSSDF